MALAVDPNWRPGMPPPTGGPPMMPGNTGGIPNSYQPQMPPPPLQKPVQPGLQAGPPPHPGGMPMGPPMQTAVMPVNTMAPPGQVQTMGAPTMPGRPNPYGRPLPQMGNAIANRVNNPYASAFNRNVVMPVRGAIQNRR